MDEIFNQPVSYLPQVNIYENEQTFEMEFNVPGIKKEAIKIQIEKGLLSIQYEHTTEQIADSSKFIRREFQQKSFKRAFNLDEKINTEGIDATYENGVLKLSLPKKRESIAPKKHITVK
jgi:HSP20 family protein